MCQLHTSCLKCDVIIVIILKSNYIVEVNCSITFLHERLMLEKNDTYLILDDLHDKLNNVWKVSGK